MSTLDRSQAPLSGPIRAFDFPEVDQRTMANGLDLRVSRMSRLPVVSVNLYVRAGEGSLRADRAGMAVLAGDAIEGGTRRRSGSEMAEAMERLGVRMGATTGWEGTSFSMSCLADRLEAGLALLAEAVLEPDFPEEEVERVREQQLAGIRQRAMDPASLATAQSMRWIFQDDIPYARPLDGTLASMSDVSRKQLQGYADAFYRPEGGGLIVVGDVDANEIEALAQHCFAGWSGAPPTGAEFEVRRGTGQRHIRVIDRPGSVQSEVRVGHVGAARSTPDYFALSVANMLLGGTFTSRLNLNLREENGFTYGVRSRFGFRSRPGPFQVSTSVGTDVTAPAVREIVAEVAGLVQGGPTKDEVESARDYAAGVFGLQLETASQIASRISQVVVYGLEPDYFHRYRDRVRAVTTDEVAASAAEHMRPEELQITVVGDADSIVGPLEALSLAPVEVASAS